MSHQNYLVDFYIETEEESIEEVKEYLNNSGIDPGAIINHFKKLISKKEAQLKIKQGKDLQEKFSSIIRGKSAIKLKEIVRDIINKNAKISFAFNKLELLNEGNAAELLNDEIKLEILRRIKEAGN